MLKGVSWSALTDKYGDKFNSLFRALMAFGAGKEKRAKKIAQKHITSGDVLVQFRKDIEAYFRQEKIVVNQDFCAWSYKKSRKDPNFVRYFNIQVQHKTASKLSAADHAIVSESSDTVESPTP